MFDADPTHLLYSEWKRCDAGLLLSRMISQNASGVMLSRRFWSACWMLRILSGTRMWGREKTFVPNLTLSFTCGVRKCDQARLDSSRQPAAVEQYQEQ